MIGKLLSNRYELIEKIGEGGMSTVYKAKCHVLNRMVAIKILKAEFNQDQDLLGKFDKEAKAAASLQHHNIVNIYDVGHDGDVHYIVMELVNCKTLKEYIKSQDVFLKNQQIVQIGLQIADALQAAHDKGIIHRDIKPQNILITEEGKIKVADFGIARAVTSSTMVNTNEAIGSVHYASPEQSRGGFIDKRSDVYSFGILLYELATGRVPFEGDTPITIALKHLKEAVVPPSLVNMNLNPTIEKMILKSIQKDANLRFQSAYEMMEKFEQLTINPDVELDWEDEQYDELSRTTILPDLSNFTEQNQHQSAHVVKPLADHSVKVSKNQENKMNPVGIAIATVVGIIVALIVLVLIFYKPFKGIDVEKEFVLEDFTGKTLVEATALAKEKGLTLKQVETLFSADTEPGIVLSQSPEAGTMIKSGREIQVIVSIGEEASFMPDLRNKTLEEVKLVIEDKGLILGAVKEEVNDLAPGLVVSQRPEPNDDYTAGMTVDLVISLGPETEDIKVPDLTGKTQEEAIQLLKSVKLNFGAIETAYSNTVKLDLVMAQSIAVDTPVKEGTLVNFTLSLGKEGGETEPTTAAASGDGTVSKSYIIPLKPDQDETVVKVTKMVNGIEEVLYEKAHKKEEAKVSISISGKGEMHILFYRDNELLAERTEMFE